MKTPQKTVALATEAANQIEWRCMSLKSQKLFFIPLTQIYWGTQYAHMPGETFCVSVKKDFIQEVIGTHSDIRHINSDLTEWYTDMLYEMNGVYKLRRDELTQEEIESFFQLFTIKNYTEEEVFLPLYMLLYRFGQYENDHQKGYLQIRTTDLKWHGFGMDIFTYCTIPKDMSENDRYFLWDYATNCTNIYYKNTDEEIERHKDYWINYCSSEDWKFATKEDTEAHFEKLFTKVHFKRSEFEKKVLLPALKEINASGMMEIFLQDTRKRGKKGQQATYEKSLFSKVYPEKQRENVEQVLKYPDGPFYAYKVKNYLILFKRIL